MKTLRNRLAHTAGLVDQTEVEAHAASLTTA
jgi:hypothetical protein